MTLRPKALWAGAAVLLLAGAVAGCSSRSAPTAAIPTASGDVGRFVWQDLVTNDTTACRRFYEALLGWDFRETTRRGRPYLIARSGGQPIGGIVQPAVEIKRATWLSYVAVADLDRAVEQAKAAGSAVLLAPVPVATYGRVAVITDPQGAPVGLAGVAVTLPAEPVQPLTGRFFWREYLARDASSALSFYQDLLGYDSSVTESRNGIDYHVLRRQRSRAGLFQIPSTVKDVEPNWLPYVKVDDPAALAARAESLGGKVLLAPSPNLRHGTLAVVADPTGAAVALQKWPL
jgi:predicted enzyme related to lactoylglutathione lyase